MTALASLPRTDLAAVSATALTRTYGEGGSAVHALRGVSLEIPAGQLTAVMGPSGSGKSTLMHLLAALDRPDAGSVRVAGQDVTTLSDRELTRLRRTHIGLLFQSNHLLPTLTVEENVRVPLAVAGRGSDQPAIDGALELAQLSEHRDLRPAELSDGEQHRVAIARSLITRPTVLFADEPTGDLTASSGDEVLDVLRAAVAHAGQTVVLFTRDPRAAAIADRTITLSGGRVS